MLVCFMLGNLKVENEVTSRGIMFTPSFINIFLLVQKLRGKLHGQSLGYDGTTSLPIFSNENYILSYFLMCKLCH